MKHLMPFTTFINEGGNSFKSCVTRGIKQTEVQATIDDIKKVLLPELGLVWDQDAVLLGSAGKKADPDELSGDLDIAISIPAIAKKHNLDPDNVDSFILVRCEELGYVVRWTQQLGILGVSWPIAGDPNKGFVQVDLMPTANFEWTKWAYYSPNFSNGESAYKGLYRNIFLIALGKEIQFNVRKFRNEQWEGRTLMREAGSVKSFDSYWFRLREGFKKVTKTYIGKTGVLQEPIRDDSKTVIVTFDPNEAVRLLFGPTVRASSIMTFEQAWRTFLSKRFAYPYIRDAVIARFESELVDQGYALPTQLRDLKKQ
jgi:hypothetical protein